MTREAASELVARINVCVMLISDATRGAVERIPSWSPEQVEKLERAALDLKNAAYAIERARVGR